MTQETTTQAANPTEGTSESEQATQSATGAVEGGTQASTDQSAEGQKPGGDSAGDQGKPEGAPEKYEFAEVEGVTVDPSVIEAFSDAAKDMNLTQDAAQGLLAKMAPVIAQRDASNIEAAKAAWAESSKTDKEFGGDKLQENLAVAQKAMEAFGTPELKDLLNASGLGNHPDVIRFMYRAGKAISEDKFRGGGQWAAPSADARSLYSKSNMNP